MKVLKIKSSGIRYWLLTLIGAFLLTLGATAQSETRNEDSAFCLTTGELKIIAMVNELRVQNKLAAIPLSKSLSIVAKTHIDDLLGWNPQEEGCSLHSWSSRGKWTACCFTKDPSGIRCMNAKPNEISGYSGKGFELIYWEDESATPEEAIDLWSEVSVSSDMLLNRGKWKSNAWKAIGAGIKDGYVVIWLGDKPENESAILVCGTDSLVQPAPQSEPLAQAALKDMEPGSGYFIIVSSFKTEEQANERLAELRTKGYMQASIIRSHERYRISVENFTSESKAKQRMKEIRNDFSDCWIYHQ